jgi:hypothetical protein
VPDLEKRLQDRYEDLVKGHTATLQDVAAGIRSLPDAADSFAATQAAWRFFKNEDTTLPILMQPLLQVADAAARSSCSEVALVACDWCQLHYSRHSSKADRTTVPFHRSAELAQAPCLHHRSRGRLRRPLPPLGPGEEVVRRPRRR